tara:strand:+ start:382 stop:561 length:180 start_codon:yes stop_codon:yes gene_type:complete
MDKTITKTILFTSIPQMKYNTLLSGVPWKELFATKWRSHLQTRPGTVRPSVEAEGGNAA